MNRHSRRRFLSDVGSGMLVAGIGAGLAAELGISTALAAEDGDELTFGKLEPLVDLMQQTPVEKLQPALVEKINAGTELKTLVAAGALANAQSFGGQDYTGFHTMMALMPAWQIAEELPRPQRALPVLKVLYRNTARIQATGRPTALRKVQPAGGAANGDGGKRLLAAMASADVQRAERTFAAAAGANPYDAYNDLQHIVQDRPDVHRVTLAWRAWDVLRLTGKEHAHTLLRQSVRYCVQREQERLNKNQPEPVLRTLVPRLLDEYKLLGRSPGKRRGDSAWMDGLVQSIFAGSRDDAAAAVAAALAEGFAAEDLGEALSLAANLLVLHDPGRRNGNGDKPRGSVHGDSVGVHASDAANAWRNISRVTNDRNRVCSLIVGAWHTAGQKGQVSDAPFVLDDAAKGLPKQDADTLLVALNKAVQAKDQARASTIVRRWSMDGHPAQPVFDALRQYAVSEDGALHAEKYFRTVTEEFPTTRDGLRWRHLVALARVSASEFGRPAPGRAQARELLKV